MRKAKTTGRVGSLEATNGLSRSTSNWIADTGPGRRLVGTPRLVPVPVSDGALIMRMISGSSVRSLSPCPADTLGFVAAGQWCGVCVCVCVCV